MKGDWLAILVLVVVLGLLLQAAGVPAMLWVIQIIGSWFAALPAPEEQFAGLLGDWAWPIALLFIVYMLRGPITYAADALAQRFERDDIEIPGYLRLTGKGDPATLKESAVSETPGDPEALDAKRIESLLEYAGDSDEKAGRLVDWIVGHLGTTLDPEEFLTGSGFVELRRRAYAELIEGEQQQ